jgi:hypothetical protein
MAMLMTITASCFWLLAVASEIYERVLYDQLQEHLVLRGAMPPELFGFMSKHSQTHALCSSYEAIKHSRRSDKCVVPMYVLRALRRRIYKENLPLGA